MLDVARLCMDPVGRLDMAAMAAFTICTRGGWIPHARHGGSGVFAFATPGSKFEGTGFEKEQIGQIHVALGSLAAAVGVGAEGLAGVPNLDGGVDPLGLAEVG